MKQDKKETLSNNQIVETSQDDLRSKILEAEVQEIIELGKKPQEEWLSRQSKVESEKKIEEALLNQKVAELRDGHVETLESPPVYSIYEIMDSVDEHDDGSVSLPLLLEDDKPKHFSNIESYQEWRDEKEANIVQQQKNSLSPYEFFLIHAKRLERPFTGQYWWLKDMGTYSCKVCTQKLFISEHKYQEDNGHANFWNHVLDAVSYRDDNTENYKLTSDNAFVDKRFKEKPAERRAV
jgi:hypothetical protein